MSLIKNIWRPDEPPRKGPNPHGDSVLTERLAELLGRELEELQESAEAEPHDVAGTTPDERKEEGDNGHFHVDAREDDNSRFHMDAGEDDNSRFHAEAEGESEQSLSVEITGEDRLSSLLREARQAVSKEASGNGGTAAITEATQEAIGQLRAAHAEIEESLRNRVDDYGRALEATISGMTREGAVSDKPIQEAAQQFQTEAREWFDEARRELREQLETSRVSLEEQLRSHHAELLQAAQQKIEAMARDSVATDTGASRQAAQEQVERWLKEQGELSRRQTEAGQQNLDHATEQAMDRLKAVEERIEASFRSQVEEYRRAVEVAAADLEKNGISQAKFQNAAEELQRMTDQVLERSTKRIEDRANQAVSRITERLSAAEQSLGTAARAAMQGALEEQQRRMSEAWQERTQAAVEAVALAGEQSRGQIEQARKTAEEGFQSAAREQGRRLVEQISGELQSSDFRERTLGEVRRQIEQAGRELMARSTAELGKQSELATSRLTSTLDKTTEKFLSQVQQRVEAAGPAWLESAGQSVQQEYRARIAKWLEEQTEATRRRAEEAGQTVEQATEQAATRLETVSRETEAALRSRLQEQQQQWLESALEEARKSGFQQKVTERAIAELEQNTSRFLEQSTRKLAEQAAASRETIAKEMDAAAHKLLEGVEASLENISWQHRGRLAQWWEERSQTAKREAESASQSVTQAAQQATSQLRTVQNELEAEMKNRARDHQMQLLESTMEEMRRSGAIERAVSEASLTLRTNANEVVTRSTEKIHDNAEAARMSLENQAMAARRGFAEELAHKVEQAQSSIEGAGKSVTEDYRRQLSVWWEERTQSARRESEDAANTITRSSRKASEQLQTIQKQIATELQSGMENYRKGLREAAADELRRQGFQRDMLETITAELDKTTRELAERSTRQLQNHLDKGLSGLDEKMKASRQAFLDDSQKKLTELASTSMEMTTSRFHELLSKNAKELEHEQEEWLQRKREAVWLEINKASASSSHGRYSSADAFSRGEKKAVSGGVLGKLVMAVMIVAMAAGLTAAFVKFAPQPTMVMQLRNDPPAGFVHMTPGMSAQQRARELQFAQAYWMLAVNNLQHRYAYHTALPATPPPDFRVDQNGLRDNAALRAHYWEELRKIWSSPQDWHKSAQSGGSRLIAAYQWVVQEFMQPGGHSKSKANP